MSEPHDIDSLKQIFYFEKKSDLARYCKVASIFKSDFAALILACESRVTPWHHRIHHRDFIPEHLQPTKEEQAALTAAHGVGPLNGKAATMMRKVRQISKERRYLVGHIFFVPTLKNWHFFYFDQRDLSARENHWDHGAHIHLINHLWPNQDAQTLWNTFRSGNVKLSGSIHIKYIRNARVP